MLTTLFIAVGLAMDAVAVSISSGLNLKGLRVSYALRIAAAFGLAQAVMPIIGWSAGYGMGDAIAGFDHWVAFGLLTIVGGRMLWEAHNQDKVERRLDPLHPPCLLLLAIATSLDAGSRTGPVFPESAHFARGDAYRRDYLYAVVSGRVCG